LGIRAALLTTWRLRILWQNFTFNHVSVNEIESFKSATATYYWFLYLYFFIKSQAISEKLFRFSTIFTWIRSFFIFFLLLFLFVFFRWFRFFWLTLWFLTFFASFVVLLFSQNYSFGFLIYFSSFLKHSKNIFFTFR
jgi:hypothetical protein